MEHNGVLITIEGIEGAGKSTVIEKVAELLSEKYPVYVGREPGGTKTGSLIRKAILSSKEFIPAYSELFLFLADRGIHVENVLKKRLKNGEVVILDRFSLSTIAYQAYGRGLDIEEVKQLNNKVTGGLEPNLVFVIDVPVEVALRRISKRRLDRIESEGTTFFEKVRQGYLTEAQKNGYIVIDGTQPVGKIVEEVLSKAEEIIIQKLSQFYYSG